MSLTVPLKFGFEDCDKIGIVVRRWFSMFIQVYPSSLCNNSDSSILTELSGMRQLEVSAVFTCWVFWGFLLKFCIRNFSFNTFIFKPLNQSDDFKLRLFSSMQEDGEIDFLCLKSASLKANAYQANAGLY